MIRPRESGAERRGWIGFVVGVLSRRRCLEAARGGSLRCGKACRPGWCENASTRAVRRYGLSSLRSVASSDGPRFVCRAPEQARHRRDFANRRVSQRARALIVRVASLVPKAPHHPDLRFRPPRFATRDKQANRANHARRSLRIGQDTRGSRPTSGESLGPGRQRGAARAKPKLLFR